MLSTQRYSRHCCVWTSADSEESTRHHPALIGGLSMCCWVTVLCVASTRHASLFLPGCNLYMFYHFLATLNDLLIRTWTVYSHSTKQLKSFHVQCFWRLLYDKWEDSIPQYRGHPGSRNDKHLSTPCWRVHGWDGGWGFGGTKLLKSFHVQCFWRLLYDKWKDSIPRYRGHPGSRNDKHLHHAEEFTAEMGVGVWGAPGSSARHT